MGKPSLSTKLCFISILFYFFFLFFLFRIKCRDPKQIHKSAEAIHIIT
uniref:Bm13337 n=1 Tax=Brugia malayi TaxID=6279 RepID=A0A1I9FZR7_BRUMA|nr:Bm13337 [Brugia malayi]